MIKKKSKKKAVISRVVIPKTNSVFSGLSHPLYTPKTFSTKRQGRLDNRRIE